MSAVVLSLLTALACLPPATAVAADPPTPVVRKLSVPPSATLNYKIRARQSGLTIDGTGLVRWQAADQTFSVTSESRANLLGKVLDARSVGTIDRFGLAPASFIDKRFRKKSTTTTFDRQSNQISFSASTETYPIKGGEQDRNSVIWQLISVARGAESKFRAGSQWTFFVAGQRDAESWVFKVGRTEKLKTPMGDINVVHVVRAPPPDSRGQKLDIWLAPSLEWYPARLRFTETDGEFVEQTLESIGRT